LIFAFLVPIIGLILGVVAKEQILRSNGRIGGMGLAQAAIAISMVFGLLVTFAMVVWLGVFFS
jgi:hypothetical protein